MLMSRNAVGTLRHQRRVRLNECDCHAASQAPDAPSTSTPAAAPCGALLGVTDGGVHVYSCRNCPEGVDHYTEDRVYTGLQWQCVELARRYLLTNHGVVFSSIDYAYQIYGLRHVQRLTDGRFFPLAAYRNGSTTLPLAGRSLLIWSAAGEFDVTGHVAVVLDVQSNCVYIAEQNVEDAVWPEAARASRCLPAVLAADGSFTISCTYTDTHIVGWVTPQL